MFCLRRGSNPEPSSLQGVPMQTKISLDPLLEKDPVQIPPGTPIVPGEVSCEFSHFLQKNIHVYIYIYLRPLYFIHKLWLNINPLKRRSSEYLLCQCFSERVMQNIVRISTINFGINKYMVASKCSRNHFSYEKYKKTEIFKLHFLENYSPPTNINGCPRLSKCWKNS